MSDSHDLIGYITVPPGSYLISSGSNVTLVDSRAQAAEALRLCIKFMPFPGSGEQQMARQKAIEALAASDAPMYISRRP